MKISRFYQMSDLELGEILPLSKDNFRHAIQVLRLKINDPLIMFNGRGGEYYAHIQSVAKRQALITIDSFDPVERESSLHSTMFLAMIKPDKMDFAIQKMVELGVTEIQPIYTKRSVIKIKPNRLEKKMLHWQGIIIAACEQSGRTVIPIIHEPKALNECIESKSFENAFVMLPGDHTSIAEQQHLNKYRDNISLLIGPEGGFTSEEEKMIQQKDITPICFGKRILRAETAAISGLTACQLFWGDLNLKSIGDSLI